MCVCVCVCIYMCIYMCNMPHLFLHHRYWHVFCSRPISAHVSIRQHTSAYVSIPFPPPLRLLPVFCSRPTATGGATLTLLFQFPLSVCASSQHTSAHVSTRQRTCLRKVSISAYVSIHQHTSAYLFSQALHLALSTIRRHIVRNTLFLSFEAQRRRGSACFGQSA